MNDSPLNNALRHFEAVDANLLKLEKMSKEIEAAIPDGIVFGNDNLDYENNCRSFHALWESLPRIDEWKPDVQLMELDDIAQWRIDAQGLGDIDSHLSVEHEIDKPFWAIREYRYRLNQKRRELTRDSLIQLIDSIDENLRQLAKELEGNPDGREEVKNPLFGELRDHMAQINTLLGGGEAHPPRWGDFTRHLHFATLGDLQDIITQDWPSVKVGLRKSLYAEREPIPVGIEDLGVLVSQKPRGPVATTLRWDRLSDEDFERVVFALISAEDGYENPAWLTKTNAPDRGRDLSVFRVYVDPLGGTIRSRVIIQCKHWLKKSVSVTDVAVLREQMKLWEPPRVDVHVIATSGRFTNDVIESIEKHNQSDSAMRIEMWANSHLELLLAHRPAIIGTFSLR